MNTINSKQLLKLLKSKLDIIDKELKKYKDIPYIFLESEAFNKIDRYGREYYKNNYLLNPNKNVSAFMKSFVYLKNAEAQLINLRKSFTDEYELIEKQIKQNE